MWTNREIKSRAKNILSRTYWKSVLGSLIVIGLTYAISSVISFIGYIFLMAGAVLSSAGTATGLFSGAAFGAAAFSAALVVMMVIIYALGFAVSIFVTYPLSVGTAKFFLDNRQQNPNFTNLFFAFKKGRYFKIVGAMLWYMLFNILWALPFMAAYGGLFAVIFLPMNNLLKAGLIISLAILIVASIVLLVYKSISYSMTAFILSDSPYIGYRRALKLSTAMTKGRIGRIFLLGLSFVGWCLLALLTCGLGYLFLMPYIMATFTELYALLRDYALRSRLCRFDELNFAQPGAEFFYQQ